MSSGTPEQPKRLAEKLKHVRVSMGLTQQAMFEALEKEMNGNAKLHFGYITRFESGSRVPSLLVLLAYARVTGITVEVLIDDNLNISKNNNLS